MAANRKLTIVSKTSSPKTRDISKRSRVTRSTGSCQSYA